MAERYSGRHIRQARHGAWQQKKRARTRPNRQLLPAAAAITVAGLLVGGAGTAMQLNPPGPGAAAGSSPAYSTDFAPDRSAQLDRANRGEARSTLGTSPTATKSQTRPSGAGAVISTGACEASYYDEGQGTASGEVFNPEAFTAAHSKLPFNSRVRVTNVANGKSVVVRINDRGPFISGRCLDLSRASFRAIANLGSGVIDVRYEVLAKDAT